MSPKPERKRPPATTPVRGRLTAKPEQLRVGDQQDPENQSSEVPDSQTPEAPKSGGLWNRLAEMRGGETEQPEQPQTPERPEPQTPVGRKPPTGRAPDPGTAGHPQPRTPRVPNSATTGVRDSSTYRVRESQTPKGQTLRVPKFQSPAVNPPTPERPVPRYLTLTRTEARLREDQVTDLAALRRRVAANRTDKSERITDNTLIRIAVDALLAHGHLLHGNTEDELRASVLGEPEGE